MHLLFLGVTKSSKNLLEVVMRKIVKRTIENKERDIVYKTISIWGLDWLKLITSTTGWVSDNYLGFCRIMKWFYFEDIVAYNIETNDNDKKCISTFLASLYTIIISIMMEYTNNKVIRQCERNIKTFLSCLYELELIHKKNVRIQETAKRNPYGYRNIIISL